MITPTSIIADLPAKGDLATTPPAWYDIGFWGYALIALGLFFIYYFFRYRTAILKFVGEVRVELEKCSWPWDPNQTGFKRYRELLESTIVVIISVVLLAGFVTSSDFILAHLVGFLTGTGITGGAPTPVAPLPR